MKKKGGKKKAYMDSQRTMVFAEPGVSVYGQVTRAFGTGRFEIACSDAITRICKIRGSFHRRVWIQVNDIVLVSLRGEDEKGDIFHKYYPYEIKQLRKSNAIPDNFVDTEATTANIEFDAL